MARQHPLILDLDGSTQQLHGVDRLVLGEWQETLRFGCRMAALDRFEQAVAAALAERTTVFLGSGDFHHLSLALIRRFRGSADPLQVVVVDNHPDNMRYPFGIHCGSWVRHAAALPFVSCVHVLGITSDDVDSGHAWESHLRPLREGRVRYWCIGKDLGWMAGAGISGCSSHADGAAMIRAFRAEFERSQGPVYLSIDKDALAAEEVRTNWDQGVLRLADLEAVIGILNGRLVAADVTGDVSAYRYRGWLKRMLSALDRQPALTADVAASAQLAQQDVNRHLLEWLAAAGL